MSEPSANAPQVRLLNKSMTFLGWNLIREALAGIAYSANAKEQCLKLTPESTYEAACRALDETAEMVSINESGESFPFDSFEDIGAILEETGQRGIAEPRQCLHLLKFIRLSRSVKFFLEKDPSASLLKEKSAGLNPLPDLFKELDRCIDDTGEIRENASPELRQAIRAATTIKEKLESAVRKLFSDEQFKDSIQDAYSTEREGRLVIPIKAESKSKIEGIIHDSSGSGATLYMEPAKIIPLNNQLKINRAAIEHEKLKILRQLSREIVQHADSLTWNQEILASLDMIQARARLAGILNASKCPLQREGVVNLRQARNPELLLNRQQVIANDIAWNPDVRVIIISGPNTGGKTVTLKTIGLMTLMARAGLFLPTGEHSRIGFFPEVYADIGDEQNIQQSLSTFSAHLQKIVHIVKFASAGSLILLDELGIATDPQEGAALAEAILLQLKQMGMLTLVSTHYLSLKTLAQTQEGFLNACTEFDQDTHRPTYRLIFGAPGSSAALETAEHLGLDPKIIGNARKIWEGKDRRADTLLQLLTQQRLAMERDREALALQMNEIQQLRQEQKDLAENLRQQEQDFLKTKTKRLQSAVRESKMEIRKLIQEIKGSRDIHKIRKAEKKIHSISRPPSAPAKLNLEEWNVPPEQLKLGDKVMLETYGTVGRLLEHPEGKKRVRIQMGNMETVVDIRNLRGASQSAMPGKTPSKKIEFTIDTSTTASAEISCNLRGMRLDEAKSTFESFIDKALLQKMGRVRVVHGHGDGVLKGFVRDYLKTTGLAKNFYPAPANEGGDGVTLIEF